MGNASLFEVSPSAAATIMLNKVVLPTPLAIGLVSMRREHLLASLLAALASSAVGTFAMWWVGSHLGFVDLAGVDIPDSTVVDAPLEITLPAMLLMWSLGSSLVILIMAIGDYLAQRRPPRNHSA